MTVKSLDRRFLADLWRGHMLTGYHILLTIRNGAKDMDRRVVAIQSSQLTQLNVTK